MKLSVKAFALACGIMWGLGLFALTLLAVYANGYGADFLKICEMYPWYEISLAGAFIGLVWGFIDGLIGGAVFAWLYNLLAKK